MAKKKYLRDGRSPVPLSESISKVMSANKGRDTKPEISLRKALWSASLRGYRLHAKSLPGRPDISYSQKKLAVFVNGCFWHRCPHCNPNEPKSNKEFWQRKFKANIERDARKIELLNSIDWQTITLWECQIRNDIKGCVCWIKKLLKS